MSEIVACICEGSAEKAIIDLLIDEDKLIFNRSSLIDHELISIRSAEKFSTEYLTRDFDENSIKIVRVLDSTKENFKIKKPYNKKISSISCHYTKPEIEILIIINENHYDTYTNRFKTMKPSLYCKKILKYHDVKNYEFVKDYFKNIDSLLEVLRINAHYSRNNGYLTIYDLVKNKEN